MGSELNMWWLDAHEIVAASERVPTAIPLRLPFVDLGPEGFERFVRSRGTTTYSSAYGSFVADASRRLFVLYVAEYEIGGARGIEALVQRATEAWRDWTVIWAVGGDEQVRRLLTHLRSPRSAGDAAGPLLDAWLDETGSPDALRTLIDPTKDTAPGMLSPESARSEVRATLEQCWADACATVPGLDDVHPYLFREAANAGGTDVTLVENGAIRSARTPATTPVLLVDPCHVGEVLRSARGAMLAPVEPKEPHGPPEALRLDLDHQRVSVLPTPANIHALLDIFQGSAWRGWSVSFGPPNPWRPSAPADRRGDAS